MKDVQTLEKAARMALKTLEYIDLQDNDRDFLSYKECHDLDEAITALRQALNNNVEQPQDEWLTGCPECGMDGECGCDKQPAQQEPVTVLPDGSAFAVTSYPLPKNHWLYADRQYNDGEYEPVELGKPILTHELSDVVVSAVRYAIRGATNCGKEVDFDPDALVQNAVYALCGPFTSPQPAQQEHKPWVGLTDE